MRKDSLTSVVYIIILKCAQTNSYDHMLASNLKEFQLISFLFVSWGSIWLSVTTMTPWHVKTRPPYTSPWHIKIRPPRLPAHSITQFLLLSFFFFFHSFTNVYTVATLPQPWRWQHTMTNNHNTTTTTIKQPPQLNDKQPPLAWWNDGQCNEDDNALKGWGGVGWAVTTKTGQNNTRCVISANSMCFFSFFLFPSRFIYSTNNFY